jgi:hypothetical protein
MTASAGLKQPGKLVVLSGFEECMLIINCCGSAYDSYCGQQLSNCSKVAP